MIPNHCSEYLTQYYGDEWSYMPAYAEREGHRTVCVEGATYKEFREDYMSGVNRGRLNRNAIRQKLYNMRIARENHRSATKVWNTRLAVWQQISGRRSGNPD